MKIFTTTNNVSRNTADIGGPAKRGGFTVAELLLVVIIISLIAGAGGGLYVGTHKRMLVEKAARGFLLTAKYARIMAIEQQCPYEIQLDVANGGFWLVTTQISEEDEQAEEVIVRDYYCKPIQFEGEVQFEDIQISPIGVETSTEDEENQAIVFSPNGNAKSAVIQIGDGKTHYSISISSSTGNAKMYFGTTENIQALTVDLDTQ